MHYSGQYHQIVLTFLFLYENMVCGYTLAVTKLLLISTPQYITKTCLFKYTENFTIKKMKIFR